MTKKTCTICLRNKSLCDFYHKDKSRTKIRSECKECTRRRNSEKQKIERNWKITQDEFKAEKYRQKREARRKYEADYRREHQEEIKANKKAFISKNPFYYKEYRQKHK